MKLQQTDKGHSETRVQAVKNYLESGLLKEVASSYNIHPITLRRWIKRYQDGGEENLKRKRNYKRHPRSFNALLEKKIVFLKENNPELTILGAQRILEEKGIKVSVGGIWGVWRRYDLAGLREQQKPLEIVEIKSGIRIANEYLVKGDVLKAAKILNALPSCPDKDILKKIPDRFLFLTRQMEKLSFSFWQMPFSEFAYKARKIREKAEKKNMFYTALRAGAFELIALDWIGNHEQQLALAQKLKKKIEKIKGRNTCTPARRFDILMAEAQSLARLGRTNESLVCIRKCENYCKHPLYSHFLSLIASFYSGIGFYKKAHQWLEKSLKFNKDNDYTNEMFATSQAMAGNYNSALKILKRLKKENARITTLSIITNSLCSLGHGNIEDAIKFANLSLDSSRKEAIPANLWSSTMTLGSCLCSLGEEKKATSLIKRVSLQLKKFKIRRNDYLSRIILDQNSLPKNTILMPDVRLALFLQQATKSLKIRDYRKALSYASSQRLIGFFHRLIPFFPKSVNKLIAKGKSTGLPKAILKLPVFNQKFPVYHIKFLGNFVVFKNRQYLKTRLMPKEKAFLIHLAVKVCEPGKFILLNDLCRNFWLHSKNPSSMLLHLLTGLKKKLMLPGHLLGISSKYIAPRLVNHGIYFTNDYNELEQSLTQAKALARAGEWSFAEKEYLRAFKLFRGEPFRKMYDQWSEDLRHYILSKLETEAVSFAKSCLEHNNKSEAQKILKMVLKTVPDSEEIKNLKCALF